MTSVIMDSATPRLAATLAPRSGVATRQRLSKREREVLLWCVQGKTSWEIGRILGITERTVNFHIYQAADRLGTRGRHATCLQALIRGLLEVAPGSSA